MRSLDDTIAAISTAPGEGGIAIVRVSGPGARASAEAVLRNRSGRAVDLQPWSIRWARVQQPASGALLDEALALWMPGPGSYTREDVLEIHCHGGQAAARAVLDAVLDCGTRLADPGEFTLRSYLRGRVDLLQAEAVLDVIRARTGEALETHEGLLDGGLSRKVSEWQEKLVHALSLLEAHLDFPEEALGELDAGAVTAAVGAVAAEMEGKLATYSWGRTAREGFTAALVGSPNTGKSSLLNRLLEEDRAIVSPVPGTTRDTIEAWLNVLGVPVRLLDTAGLRRAGNAVEEEGIRRARAAAQGADVVVLLCDGGRELTSEERWEAESLAGSGRAIPVVNKVDLGAAPGGTLERLFGRPPLLVSALTGDGVPGLLEALREAAWSGRGPRPEAPLTRLRHRQAVEQALAGLRRALRVLGEGRFPEVAASELHGARGFLAELLGWGTPEDVLDEIFSEFCIGK
ncbi:MAG: tRNA uridine-5-carboxymethylaminomethyl(34) synthesis GTPase MnmE [Proteobacteria bacterium]|nr:tRNA uridine-5-carboxymethylaminomethyl(34) synthesis GTPase MnmE [Pseudomonadota bacterium]